MLAALARTYSPVVVLLVWAGWVLLFGRSDAIAVIGLVALAAALGLHVAEERNGRRS